MQKSLDLKLFSEQGFVVISDFLDRALVVEAQREIVDLQKQNKFQPAKVGKGEFNQERLDIRSDGTSWWDFQNLTSSQKKIFEKLDEIKNTMNQNFFLGLWEIEGHYAIYQPGAFYKKHLDRFQNDSKRTVSVVLFFNNDWKPEQGGQLVLDLGEKSLAIEPKAGTLVCFKSDQIPHQVLETHRQRLSFAGWFKTR